MTRLRSILVLLVCGLLCGCIQYEHPLSPLSEATYDEQVFGSWQLHANNEEGKVEHLYLHIGAASEKEGPDALDRNYFLLGMKRKADEVKLQKMTRVIVVMIKANDEVTQMSFLAFPSEVDGYHYMNAPLIMDGKIFSYGIVKYRLDGEKLTVWGEANNEAIKKLKKEGKIQESEKGNLLGENAEGLRKLFVENDTELFPPNDSTTLERILPK